MRQYSRREVLKVLGSGAAAVCLPSLMQAGCAPGGKKKHFVTLSFDDGLRKSSIRTAEIYEKYHLSACINVIATAHLPDFIYPNEYHRWPAGDFGLWNELQARGHEIMMHGYKHEDLRELPFGEAKDSILRCMDVFSRELRGFEPRESVFNFPYNASTPELEEWLPTQVRAFRTGGPALNPVPHRGQAKLTCTSSGPENIDRHLESEIETLLAAPSGWLVYNAHGLDDEGWGPLGAGFLDRLLERLVSIESVKVVPAGKALAEV
jgi:peptidoglycan/xylan/chitin deacetylase (PgdA/CDA1 family)